MKSYAGIGSRETPRDVLDAFVVIGSYLAKHGYTLRSGGAQGADEAFERGCDQQNGAKEIFLPWSSFRSSTSSLVVSAPEAFSIAAKHHPRWDSLSDAAQKLLARNTHQILGWTFDSPSNFVVCWTKGGLGAGGTGQAIRVANAYGVPVFDAGRWTNIDEMKLSFNSFIKPLK